ncbi:MAG: LD-carboxypeptidase [Lachnospiraceae bacterium]|nr:LD-carboxypeptidase [Lachnospiraceae bacterium]
MIVPKYTKAGDTIGVTAPSSGIVDPMKIKRFESAQKQLSDRGYKVVFTDNVFKADERGCSSSGTQRAKEFEQLLSDKNVTAVISAAGGDYLMEMLEHLDYEFIKKNPKWIQGYSDNTGLLYSITTKCDIATVYGFNFSDFGMNPWQESVIRGLEVLEGNTYTQDSFEYYESVRHDYETGLEGYFYDEKVCWKNGRNEDVIEMEGRLLGGCFDVISFLTGTKYEDTLGFIDRYKDDGIIWFLESFCMNDMSVITNLWRLKEMGYFNHATGFVFGRPLFYESWVEQRYEDAVMSILKELNVPVIFDADIGHKGPQLSMINGAKARLWSKGGKGRVTYLQ